MTHRMAVALFITQIRPAFGTERRYGVSNARSPLNTSFESLGISFMSYDIKNMIHMKVNSVLGKTT